MSDIIDSADESVSSVTARRGVFEPTGRSRAGYVTPRSKELASCSCGAGRPRYAPHPPLRRGGDLLEVLKCPSCGNFVGPFSSRAALAMAWRMGGYKGDKPAPLLSLSTSNS